MTTAESKVLADIISALRALRRPDGECIDVIHFYVTRCLETPPGSVSKEIVTKVVQAAVEDNLLVHVNGKYSISPALSTNEELESSRMTSRARAMTSECQSLATRCPQRRSAQRRPAQRRPANLRRNGGCPKVKQVMCDDHCRRDTTRCVAKAATVRATGKKRKACSPPPVQPTKRAKLTAAKRRNENRNDVGRLDHEDSEDSSPSSEASPKCAKRYRHSSTDSSQTETPAMTRSPSPKRPKRKEEDIRALLATVSGQLDQVIKQRKLCPRSRCCKCRRKKDVHADGNHRDADHRSGSFCQNRNLPDLAEEALDYINHLSTRETDFGTLYVNDAYRDDVSVGTGEVGSVANIMDPNFGEEKLDHLDCQEDQHVEPEATSVFQSDTKCSGRHARGLEQVETSVQDASAHAMDGKDKVQGDFQDQRGGTDCPDDEKYEPLDTNIDGEEAGLSRTRCSEGARSPSMTNLLTVDVEKENLVGIVPSSVSAYGRCKSTTSLSAGRVETVDYPLFPENEACHSVPQNEACNPDPQNEALDR